MRNSLLLLAVSTVAYADAPKPADVSKRMTALFAAEAPTDMKGPRIAIGTNTAADAGLGEGRSGFVFNGPGVSLIPELKRTVIGFSADGTAGWYAADAEAKLCMGSQDDCEHKKPDEVKHVAIVLDRGARWEPLAWHITNPTTAKQQTAAIKKARFPDQIDKRIVGADDVVKLFDASIADPKLLAASVSERADVVLYGSDFGERWVGGKVVSSQLAAWKLAFTVRDGEDAGLSTSKTVAYVAANLDARPVGKPKVSAVPYRVLFAYEKVGGIWKLVLASFSAVPYGDTNGTD